MYKNMFNLFKKKQNIVEESSKEDIFLASNEQQSIFEADIRKVELQEPLGQILMKKSKINSDDIPLSEKKDLIQNQNISNYNSSVNNGFSSLNLSKLVVEPKNFNLCMYYSQMALMNKILKNYSDCIFEKGFKPIFDKEKVTVKQSEKLEPELMQKVKQYDLINVLKKFRYTDLVFGGALLLRDYGQDYSIPFNEEYIEDIYSFQNFKVISCYDTGVVQVNASYPSQNNFMQPTKYFVNGLGETSVADYTNFIKLEGIKVVDRLKPVYFYFGNSLCQMIRAEVSNCSIVSQNMVEFTSKLKNIYMKIDKIAYQGKGASKNFSEAIKQQLYQQSNSGIFTMGLNEQIQQFQGNLNGFPEVLRTCYENIASNADIPLSMVENSNDIKISNSDNQDTLAIDFKVKQQQLFKPIIVSCLNTLINTIDTKKFGCVIDIEFDNLYNMDGLKTVILEDKKQDILRKQIQNGLSIDYIKKQYMKEDKEVEFDKDFEKIQQKIIDSEFKATTQDTGAKSGNVIKQKDSATDNRQLEKVREATDL